VIGWSILQEPGSPFHAPPTPIPSTTLKQGIASSLSFPDGRTLTLPATFLELNETIEQLIGRTSAQTFSLVDNAAALAFSDPLSPSLEDAGSLWLEYTRRPPISAGRTAGRVARFGPGNARRAEDPAYAQSKRPAFLRSAPGSTPRCRCSRWLARPLSSAPTPASTN